MNWSNQPLEELVALWIVRRDERRNIAFDRVIYFLKHRAGRTNSDLDYHPPIGRMEYEQNMLLLGIAHGKANNRVLVVEEEIIHRFPGQSVTLEDGRVVKIGTPGCRLHDRIQVLNESEEV
jgi:hypothetical protein